MARSGLYRFLGSPAKWIGFFEDDNVFANALSRLRSPQRPTANQGTTRPTFDTSCVRTVAPKAFRAVFSGLSCENPIPNALSPPKLSRASSARDSPDFVCHLCFVILLHPFDV